MCKEGFDVICEQQVFDCHQYHENEGDELVSHLKGHHLNESSVITRHSKANDDKLPRHLS